MSIMMSIYQSVCLSIYLPEFSMSGKLHDNPERITGVDNHDYIDVYLSVSQSVYQSLYLSYPCQARFMTIQKGLLEQIPMSILMSIHQSVSLSISLPEFSMSGELHDNPDRITGAYSHEFDEDDQTVYLSLYLSSPCLASSMTIQIRLLE